MKNKKAIIILGLLVAAIFGLYQLKYSLLYFSDLRSRPWAYSRDPAAKLLVGTWQGDFVDPAGLAKSIELEIFVPVTDEERRRQASRTRSTRRGRLGGSDKRSFDGKAVVTSRLGEERYEVFGWVEKSDMHQVEMRFSPEDEAKRVLPNDTLQAFSSGRWEGDRLIVRMAFSRQDAQGHSSSSSEGVVVDGKVVWSDSPADEQVEASLSRRAAG